MMRFLRKINVYKPKERSFRWTSLKKLNLWRQATIDNSVCGICLTWRIFGTMCPLTPKNFKLELNLMRRPPLSSRVAQPRQSRSTMLKMVNHLLNAALVKSQQPCAWATIANSWLQLQTKELFTFGKYLKTLQKNLKMQRKCHLASWRRLNPTISILILTNPKMQKKRICRAF